LAISLFAKALLARTRIPQFVFHSNPFLNNAITAERHASLHPIMALPVSNGQNQRGARLTSLGKNSLVVAR
jgi:hypothetical protein